MKKNLIFIVADQLRYDVLSKELTPNIWSIKEESVDFARAYCACPLCVPSRGALFTGVYPNRNGSLINPWLEDDKKHGDVHAGIDNIYTLMENDWDSIHSGKQHLFTEGGKLEDRKDSKTKFITNEKTYHEFLDANGKKRPGGARFKTPVPEMVGGKRTRVARYSNPSTGCYKEGAEYFYDCYFTDKCLEALKERDKEKPLFLSQMFVAPHPPLDIPEPWYSRISPDSVQLPDNVAEYYKYQSPMQMYNLTGVIGSHYQKEEWKESWRVYLGLVSLLDDMVGRILDEIKRQGIYDDSLIIFTSDHGEMLGSHSLYQKMCMYEESSHVPLYMKFPKDSNIGAKRLDQVVSLIDVLPTITDFFSIEHKTEFDGSSLLPLIHGECDSVHDEIFIQYDGNGSRSNFQRCVVSGEYKLMVDLFKDEYYLELYNVVNDPEEKENLIFSSSSYDSLTKSLVDKVRGYMEGSGDLISLPDVDVADFRSSHIKIGARQRV